MKKILLTIVLFLSLNIMTYAQTGSYTTNGYFYLPDYGAYGVAEYGEYNDYMQIADTQIEANKTNSFTTIDTEAELESAISDVTGIYTNNDFIISDYYLKTAIDTQGEMETIWGVSLMNELADDTDPDLAGNLGMNEKSFEYDMSLSSDHTYSGDVYSVTVGESVVLGELLYPDATDGEYKKANASGTGTYPAVFIALESKSDGQSCKVLVRGLIRDDSWNWSFGDILLLGETAGDITATVPSDSGDMVQRIGHAISADVIDFNPSIDVGEI
ncbi:MAG: hypothetical protein ACOWWR_18545 [Eubacteriales bacterium]